MGHPDKVLRKTSFVITGEEENNDDTSGPNCDYTVTFTALAKA